MARWKLTLSLDGRDGGPPLFVRIAHAVAADVRRGRLRPGDALPGQRALAADLGVDRDTVIAAFRELRAQGWIVVRPSRGAFVADGIPHRAPVRAVRRSRTAAAPPDAPGFSFVPPAADPSPPWSPAAIDLAGSSPDLREFPADDLARALRRQLRRSARSLLRYGDPRGHAGLRAEVARMLSDRRGLACGADDVLIVRGSQMGLHLAAHTLLRPGDAVAVEELGYVPAWSALSSAGARLVPLPVDDEGLDVGALETALRTQRIRAVYVTPHHQYPTTVTLSPARRLRLLDAARRHGFAILEDDYDHEFHYEGRPVLPLASADPGGHVVYVGTLSKTLAPSLRIGFVVAARRVVEAMTAMRLRIDHQGDTAMEAAIADLMTEGLVQRHVWRMQRLCRARRDALTAALTREMSGRLSFRPPSGGTAVWVRAAPGLDVEAWARRCLADGVLLRTGKSFTRDGRAIPHARLQFAAHREAEIDEAVRRIARCARKG